MQQLKEKTIYRLIVGAAALGATLAVQAALNAAYETGTDKKPPMNPAAPEVPWGKAISYTVVTGVAVGLAQLLVRRGTASGWKRITGRLPHGTNELVS